MATKKMPAELKGRIVIGYYNLGGFYQDVIITRHRHLDDLILDFKRMLKTLTNEQIKPLSRVVVHAIGEIDDEIGTLIDWPKKELIIQFPEYIPEEVK